jgi:hypothetical protein
MCSEDGEGGGGDSEFCAVADFDISDVGLYVFYFIKS